ncbi:signal recognition particle-docking protein FtsY [Candidatus Woesearchaeota archaeon]|nr:signal recognition particle-docking protein FtsY [Candidatus Woesearchaeota archaeon]
MTHKVEEEAPKQEIEVKAESKVEKPKKESKKKVCIPKEKVSKPKVEEKQKIQEEQKVLEESKEKKSFLKKLFTKKEEPSKISPDEEPKGEKDYGFFEKITRKITLTTINEKLFDEIFWELELAMLENNVAVEVIEKIKEDLKKDLVDKQMKKQNIEPTILESLRKSINSLFTIEPFDLIKAIKSKKEKPYVIAFVGINGSGKTTTIAKIAYLLKEKGFSPVLAAADTFRAAAIQQLEEHANKLNLKIIKQDYGSDPAAVCFDAIKHAKAKNNDVVLIDTAGRMHSNQDLVREMEKIIRISNPDLKIFIGESITGNDCVEQAKIFNQSITIDGIILSKADVDDKGGAAISVSYVTGKPILYLGTGQKYTDLTEFNKEKILSQLGL